MLTAIKRVADSSVDLKGDIIFTATAGEETDSSGIKKFVENWAPDLKNLAGVIIPEPTDFDIITAHRGMLWLNISTSGRTCHGSMPHLGINAVSSMTALLNELSEYKIPCQPHELLGDCSMSINTIQGGKAINVVPDKCTIGVDIRTVPGQEHQAIIDGIKKIFEKIKQGKPQFDADISIIRQIQALQTDSESDFVRDFCSAVKIAETKAVGFTTDGPHLAKLGAAVLIFGPGKPDLCHKPDEYIEIADLEKAVEYYETAIRKFLT